MKEKILRIRIERERKGWSQQKLQEMTGINQSDISQMERGVKPPFPSWKKAMAETFNMKAEDLFREVA